MWYLYRLDEVELESEGVFRGGFAELFPNMVTARPRHRRCGNEVETYISAHVTCQAARAISPGNLKNQKLLCPVAVIAWPSGRIVK